MNLTLHHVGYVVNDIERFSTNFIGLTLIEKVYDPVQKADLALYQIGLSTTYIELVKPLEKSSMTWSHLNEKGSGFHHICYQGIHESELSNFLRSNRMLLVLAPVMAVLFNRKVAFAVDRNRSLIEFLL